MSNFSFPAVAADSAASTSPEGARFPVINPTTTADAAGRGGNYFIDRPHYAFSPQDGGEVEYIAPYRGCSLVWFGFEPTHYKHDGMAVRDARGNCRVLDVSRFTFTPTAERFRWLIDNACPDRNVFGRRVAPIDNAMIDAAIAQQVAA